MPSQTTDAMIRTLLTCASVALAGTSVHAEIKDYMILRLVYLDTTCGTETLSQLEVPSGLPAFKVTCRNVTDYPDGLVITCSDMDDDRSCRLDTKSREFKNLRMLEQK